MKALVTGAAGFIGSSMVDRLLAAGHEVTGFDNFSTGMEEFLEPARENPGFRLIRGDLLDQEAIGRATGGCEFVFHLAANADVQPGDIILGGTGIYFLQTVYGDNLTIANFLTAMLLVSDNTAVRLCGLVCPAFSGCRNSVCEGSDIESDNPPDIIINMPV